MLTDEQSKQIKEQILKQLVNFPEDKRDLIKKQILALTNEQLEQFLRQNQLAHLTPKQKSQTTPGSPQNQANHPQEQTQCIFCLILQGQIPSYKIDENKDNIAILEINPISKGHALIIPKKHLDKQEKIPTSSFALAKKIARKIQTRFHPIEIKITSQKITDHSIVEVLPLYENTIPDKRTKASEEELQDLKKELEVHHTQKTATKKSKKSSRKNKEIKNNKSNLPVLKPRIP